MRIRMAQNADQGIWDSYVFGHLNGLAYHRFAWKRAVETAYGFAGKYLLAETEGRIRGVLPMIFLKRPLLGGTLVSLPYCDVGGVLADDSMTQEALVKHAQELARECRAKVLDLRFSQPRGSCPSADGVGKVRMVLDLPESSEALLAGFKAKLRSQVLKPARDGLSFRVGGTELLADFYAVFTENMRDLGSPVHSREWFGAILRFFDEYVRVGVVYAPDGAPAAGGLILLHGATVTVPWASSLRRYNRLNPNMLLYWSFLSFAADREYKHFDFGRSTPGEGTYRFKKQWGAQAIPLDWREVFPTGVKAAGGNQTVFREQIEAVWRRMPLALCNFLGPRIRRYVSF